MKAYRVVGSFRQGKKDQEFSMDLVAEDEAGVKEKIMSNFGSRHGAKRRQNASKHAKNILRYLRGRGEGHGVPPKCVARFDAFWRMHLDPHF